VVLVVLVVLMVLLLLRVSMLSTHLSLAVGSIVDKLVLNVLVMGVWAEVEVPRGGAF